MLQRILAGVLVFAGLVCAALGIASATIWRPSDTVVATAQASKDGTAIVTDPGVLDLVSSKVQVRATAPAGETVTVAVGRDVDVQGWAADAPHTVVTGLKDWDTLAVQAASPSASPSGKTSPSPSASPSASPSPSASASPSASPSPTTSGSSGSATVAPGSAADGGDMWLKSDSGTGSASLTWDDQPGRWSALAVSSGKSAPTLTLSWTRSVSTPWLWPGVGVGLLLVAGGVFLLIVEIRSRRSRKPRGEAPLEGGRRAKRQAAQSTPPDDEDVPTTMLRAVPASENGTDSGPKAPTGAHAAVPPAQSGSTAQVTPARGTPTHALPMQETGTGRHAAPTGAIPTSSIQVPASGTTPATPIPTGNVPLTNTGSIPAAPRDVDSTQILPPARTRREMRERAESGKAQQQQRRAWLTGQIPIVRRPQTGAQPTVPPGDQWRRMWGFTGPQAQQTDTTPQTGATPQTGQPPTTDSGSEHGEETK